MQVRMQRAIQVQILAQREEIEWAPIASGIS
jgi:hypothetical protein